MLVNLATHYHWWLLALVLIAAELLLPGYFMLWIGIAAGIVGAIVAFVPDLALIAQVVLFGLFALLTCGAYWKFVRPFADTRDDQPLLNKRGARMVGRRVVVAEPIEHGRGKVRMGDTLWLAEGPDVPAGAEVEVVSVDGTVLKVRTAS